MDWNALNREFLEKLGQEAPDAPVSRDALQLLINTLGDKHAAFRLREGGRVMAAYSGAAEDNDTRDTKFINTVINDVSAQFSFAKMSPDIGYLKVVGIGPGDVRQQAEAIRGGIATLVDQGARRWVLDLRYHGGGNMNPMLAGLAPLLSEGTIGGSVDAKDSPVSSYEIRQGQFYDTGRLAVDFGQPGPTIEKNPKIAVLVSRYTISSGELVAVAFKGQPNTRFFGEPSAGYTTVTGYDAVSDEMIMLLSLSVFTDRAGRRYDGGVGVDEFIEFQHQTGEGKGPIFSSAIEWLGQD